MTDLARRGLAIFCASHAGSRVWPFKDTEQEPGIGLAPPPAAARDAREWAPGPAISTAPIVDPVRRLEHDGFFASAIGTSPAIATHRAYSRRGPTRRCDRGIAGYSHAPRL